jgi:hypothetical protein
MIPEPSPDHHVTISARTKQGMIEIAIRAADDAVTIQLELPKAREIVGMLTGAIEAAVSDQLLYEFLTQRIGIAPEAVGPVLLDFRELRQGTRGTAWPPH